MLVIAILVNALLASRALFEVSFLITVLQEMLSCECGDLHHLAAILAFH
jgi:hypothetical protein